MLGETEEIDLEEVKKAVVEWCGKNEFTVYADYRDELPHKWANKILAAKTESELDEVFMDLFNEVDEWLMDYRDETETHQFKVMLEELGYELESGEEEELFEYFRDYFIFYTSDYVKSLLSSCRANIVATPLYNGEYLEAPCAHDYDEEYNQELGNTLKEVLGFTDEEIQLLSLEATYGSCFLRVCGRIDFSEIYRTCKPVTHITFGAGSTILFHNSYNGSGACWEPKIKKDSITLPAEFRVDNDWKYGVDSVYGMCGSFWKDELKVGNGS